MGLTEVFNGYSIGMLKVWGVPGKTPLSKKY